MAGGDKVFSIVLDLGEEEHPEEQSITVSSDDIGWHMRIDSLYTLAGNEPWSWKR